MTPKIPGSFCRDNSFYFFRQSLTPWATGWGAAAKPVSASIADIWTRPIWNSPWVAASNSSLGCTNKINQNSCEVFQFWTVLIFQGLPSPCYSAWWEHLSSCLGHMSVVCHVSFIPIRLLQMVEGSDVFTSFFKLCWIWMDDLNTQIARWQH